MPVPAEVTRVTGCDCGGLEWHRAADWRQAGCPIWNLPPGEAAAATDDALGRLSDYTAGLNAALDGRTRTSTATIKLCMKRRYVVERTSGSVGAPRPRRRAHADHRPAHHLGVLPLPVVAPPDRSSGRASTATCP